MSRLYYAALLVILASNYTYADWLLDGPTISITPQYPQEGQTITLILPVYGCYLGPNTSADKFLITENGATINVSLNQADEFPCPAVGPGGIYWWEMPLEIGARTPGNYLVNYEIHYHGVTSYQGTTSFAVQSAQSVPVSSPWITMLMVVILAVIALTQLANSSRRCKKGTRR